MVNLNLLSYFHAFSYHSVDDLAEEIMNPPNWLSTTVNLSTRQF